MKKLLTLALVVCFAFSVVGCGGGDDKGGKKDSGKSTEKKDDKK